MDMTQTGAHMVKIYTLADPRDGAIRYVGQTVLTLERRLANHLHEARDRASNNPGKREWIRGLTFAGLSPAIALLDDVPEASANASEAHWIKRLRADGTELLNVVLPRRRVHGVTRQAHGEKTEHGLLTVPQAAAHLGLDTSRLRRYVESGRVPATKHGRDWMLRPADVHAFAELPRRHGRPPGGSGCNDRPNAAELIAWRAAFRAEYPTWPAQGLPD